MRSAPRYFLSQDAASGWYLVDASKRAEWNAWLAHNASEYGEPRPPAFARRLLSDPSALTFSDPYPIAP